MIEWFWDLSDDKAVESEMDFIEPNLSFQLLDKSKEEKTIQIKFDLESRPQSADDEKNYHIAFNFSNQQLSEIANDLTL